MVRALVQDRFKVRVHNEQRDAPIYALVLARPDGKTGASLHSVPDACAEAMKAMTERTPRSGPPPCSFRAGAGKLIGTAPSIFTALQEQLGLKLESTRGLVEVLVIDSAERPTPN